MILFEHTSSDQWSENRNSVRVEQDRDGVIISVHNEVGKVNEDKIDRMIEALQHAKQYIEMRRKQNQ